MINKTHIVTALLLFLITLASLALKYAYIENTEIISPIRADAKQYVIYGYNLYQHGIFSLQKSNHPTPDSYRSPGFPLLIALAFYIGGIENCFFLTLLMQITLTSLLIPLSYILARALLPHRWSLGVSLLVASSPHLMSISSYMLTESLLSFLFLTAITCFVYGNKNSNKHLILYSSVFFGLSYLTNEVILFIPFIISGYTCIYVLLTKESPKDYSHLKIILIGLIIFSLFPAGWGLRNFFQVTDASMKGGGRALSTLTHGTYPDFTYKNPGMKYFPYREDPEQPEYSSSVNKFIEIFTRRVKERPLRYLSWYLIEKPYYLWTWNIMQGQGDIYIYPIKSSLFTKYQLANKIKTFLKYLHFLMQFAILLGFITLFFPQSYKGKNLPVFTLVSIFVYLTILYAIFVPWPRYAIPFRPIFYTLGVWAIHSVYLLTKTHLSAKSLQLTK